MSERPPLRDPRFAPQQHHAEILPTGEWRLENRTAFAQPFHTTYEPLLYWAAASPERTWMAERDGDRWRRVAYADAAVAVGKLAGGLLASGLRPGQAILIAARNSLDHAVLTYAAHLAGLDVVAVSPQYVMAGADPDRLARVLELIGPAAYFIDDPAAAERTLQTHGSLRTARRLAPSGSQEALSLDRLDGAARRYVPHDDPQHARLVMMTSGSTGKPKAVVYTQATMSTNAAQLAGCYADPEAPVIANAAPWSHALGAVSVRQYILHRGGALYIDPGQPTPAGFAGTLWSLGEVSPTYHHMVPAGWALLADALERDPKLAATFFRNLRVMQYGGAGLPQAVCDRVQAVALRTVGEQIAWVAGYGCTESGPVVCNVHWPNTAAGVIGLPVPGTTLRLWPTASKLEICARGPQLSPGYLTTDGETSPLPRDDEGFYHLGDAAKPTLLEGRPVITFDGRLSENFKLASGTFVTVGALRLSALSAMGGIANDCIVCGEGRAGLGLLIFLNREFCSAAFGGSADLRDLANAPAVRGAVVAGLSDLNAGALGSAGRVSRAMILAQGPDPLSGELTEKGYLNQALCRVRYEAEIDRLFADDDPDVLRIA